MDATTYLYIFIILAAILLAYIIYILFAKIGKKERIREDIMKLFNAKEYGDALQFTYRGYQILVTFRPDVKINISHNKNIEGTRNIPKGMKLTPMFLIIRIRKREEIKEKIDEGVSFLDSIPTQ